ncbi:MAG: outer membrane lipoprotein carrier protein LolA [Flavobacteriaceae bacterium]|nr:outer membrane lipoprotein carrier protein LolA [Flavobacteriaceae bacterium]
MHKFIFYIYSLLIIVSVHAQQTQMSQAEIDIFKSRVKTIANNTKTILSDFTQYKHLEFLSNDIKTSGKMSFKAPNLIKWEYTDPYKYSVIFKEDQLLINDDGKKSDVKIGSSKMFKKLNHLIVNSVSGNLFDDNEFDISYYKTDSFYVVKFTSKDKNLSKYIKEFILHFDKRKLHVTEVKMVEPSDDYTQILFKNRQDNIPLKDEVFTN